MTKKDQMYARIRNHGESLKTVFELDPDTDEIALCKKLRKLEFDARNSATEWCNGDISEDEYTLRATVLRMKVVKILGDRYPIFLNGDPRGYALKIDDKIVRENNLHIYRDWGGYGIISPDLTEA